MNTYLALIRGINVGGKNKVSMAALREHLERAGYYGVSTYIASGNVMLKSQKDQDQIATDIERTLAKSFELDSEILKVLVLSSSQIRDIVQNKPKGFGDQPEKYYSDVIFLIGIGTEEALKVFDPREGVDKIWPGSGVIYSQRLGTKRTKSRLSKIVGTPAYKSMTIRSWNTTTKLLSLMTGPAG